MLFKNTIESSTLELLKSLQSEKILNDFHLVGGTALALQIGHRKSIDLDLFSQFDFDVNEILEFLEQHYDFQSDFTAINTLKGSIHGVKIDIISHKYPLVKSPINIDNIRVLSIEDISAMKLNAIAGNGTRSKDFIDMYFLLKTLSVEDVINNYQIKYSSRNKLHALKSLNYFNDIETQDWPEMILEEKLKIMDVKKIIEKKVNEYNRIVSGK